MIWYVQVQYYYTLGLSRNFNPHLVSPKYLRYIFFLVVLRQLPPSQPAPCYSKITTHAKTPTSCEIPTREMPVVPLNQRTASNRWGYFCNTPYILDKRVPKSCFTPSHRPFSPFEIPCRHNLFAPTAKPHPPLSAMSPLPSQSLFPDNVVHRNSSTSLVHLLG